MTFPTGPRAAEPASLLMASSKPLLLSYFTALEGSSHLMAPLKGLARAQLEMASFVNHRAQAYLELPSRLLQCRGPHDFLQEQMRFWNVAAEHYSETTRRIADAWGHSTAPADETAAATNEPAQLHDYIEFPVARRKQEAAQNPAPGLREMA